MSEMPFEDQAQENQFIIEALNLFARKIQLLEFDGASECIDRCSDLVEKESQVTQPSCDEAGLNHLFVVAEFLFMLRDYSLYWGKVFERDFVGSWNTLQDIQDRLRILKKFCGATLMPYIKATEKQVVAIEKLYPYKIFASSEIIVSDVKCSICGKNIESLDCSHISGELYSGKMAYGIVGKIEAVNAIALVEHPADKRCVIQLENTEENFLAVAKLSDLIRDRTISPWQVAGTRESRRRMKIDELNGLQHDDRCPCRSGKTFQECCLPLGYVEVPHIDILLSESRMPIFKLSST